MSTGKKSRIVQITSATLRTLNPSDADWFVRDSNVKGFQIKVPPSGNAVYQVEARLGGTGKVKKFKIGNVSDLSLDDAKEQASIALTKIRQGVDPLKEKRAETHEGRTLRELVELYIETQDLKPRTIEDYKRAASKRFSGWLDKRVKDIAKHEVLDWYVRNKEKAGTQTDQAFRFLNALMNFAIGMEIIAENPCVLVSRTRVRHRSVARHSHIDLGEDIGKFFSAFIDYPFNKDSERVARDIILLILVTGLRSNEAKTIKWEYVDFDRRKIKIPDTKNRRDHVIPMIPLTYALLRYRAKHSENSEYVFRIKKSSNASAKHVTDFRKTLSNICKRAEIPIVTPHDLRRTFATVLNSLGVGYADLQHLMNHKARDVTSGVYIQPNLGNMAIILHRVVNFYDRKIPFYDRGQGVSQFTSGVLAHSLYGYGDASPEALVDPREEDVNWKKHDDHLLWGDD